MIRQGCLRSIFPASTRMAAGNAWQRAASSFLTGRGAEALKSWLPSGDVRVICEIPFGTARFGLGRTSDNQDLIHSLHVDDSQGCLRSVFPASTRMAAGSAWQRAASSFLTGRGAEALKSWPPSGDVRVICEIPFGTARFGLGRTSDNQDLIHSLHVDDSQGCLRSVFPASTRMAAGSAWQRVVGNFLTGRGAEALKSWPPSGDVRVICEIPFGTASRVFAAVPNPPKRQDDQVGR